MLTQNLPEGSMRLHSQFSHEGSSAKRRHTTAKGCGLSSSSCTTVFSCFFFFFFCKVESGCPLWASVDYFYHVSPFHIPFRVLFHIPFHSAFQFLSTTTKNGQPKGAWFTRQLLLLVHVCCYSCSCVDLSTTLRTMPFSSR